MKNNVVGAHTQGKWEIGGSLDDLTVFVTHNKDTDDEKEERIALVRCYDNCIPNYERSESNAKLIADAGTTFNQCNMLPSELLLLTSKRGDMLVDEIKKNKELIGTLKNSLEEIEGFLESKENEALYIAIRYMKAAISKATK